MRDVTVALIGNPNCGKTTLFNALTASNQRIGNWPGVTVERKSGFFKSGQSRIEVIDLPGIYSLMMASPTASIDERIACEFILKNEATLFLNIVDANHLERHLYLTMQLIEMHVPMVVVLNMMDIVAKHKKKIKKEWLAKKLNCPVVLMEAHKGKGIAELKKIMSSHHTAIPQQDFLPAIIDQAIQTLLPAIQNVTHATQHHASWLALRLLEDDWLTQQRITPAIQTLVCQQQQKIKNEMHEDADIIIADARYRRAQAIANECVIESNNKIIHWTQRIDNIVLNRILGIPFFLGVMYCLFLFAINVGGAFQDFFDISSNTIFVDGFAYLLSQWHAPNWLIAFLANGVGKGINTTITFIPVIGALFLFLSLLEDSGYMARAAFVIDRMMRVFGLPGKAFVPMIIGFGCNVPAVMAARTLDNQRDRILTIMMSPFMSCSARLAIYAVFTAAFFPHGGQNIVFALYIIGIVMAMLTGLLLRKTVLHGEPAPLILELPPYHLPHFKTLARNTWQRLKGFILRAGKLIIPICIVIGVLNTLNIDGSINTHDADTNSLLSYVGKLFTPLFAPMGIHADNWPATVGLVTGVLAKEVVVGTLNSLYSQIGHFNDLQISALHFWENLHAAVLSIPANLSQLGNSFANPILANAPVHTLSQRVYGLMYQRFDGQIGAMAYLLFVLLYFPCVSTTAVMLREMNRAWTWFSVGWSTGIAYAVAVSFYQIATFNLHPLQATAWIIGLISVLAMTMHILKKQSTVFARG